MTKTVTLSKKASAFVFPVIFIIGLCSPEESRDSRRNYFDCKVTILNLSIGNRRQTTYDSNQHVLCYSTCYVVVQGTGCCRKAVKVWWEWGRDAQLSDFKNRLTE